MIEGCLQVRKRPVEPEKKSEMVRRLVREGNLKQALRIAKDFRLGITGEQKKAMALAYECMVHGDFYKALEMDTEKLVREGTEVLKALF